MKNHINIERDRVKKMEYSIQIPSKSQEMLMTYYGSGDKTTYGKYENIIDAFIPSVFGNADEEEAKITNNDSPYDLVETVDDESDSDELENPIMESDEQESDNQDSDQSDEEPVEFLSKDDEDTEEPKEEESEEPKEEESEEPKEEEPKEPSIGDDEKPQESRDFRNQEIDEPIEVDNPEETKEPSIGNDEKVQEPKNQEIDEPIETDNPEETKEPSIGNDEKVQEPENQEIDEPIVIEVDKPEEVGGSKEPKVRASTPAVSQVELLSSPIVPITDEYDNINKIIAENKTLVGDL